MDILVLGKWIMVGIPGNAAFVILEVPFAVNLNFFFIFFPLAISYGSFTLVLTTLNLSYSFITVSKKWCCHFLSGQG